MVNKQLEKRARLEAEAVVLKLKNQCESYGLKPECKLLLGHERVGSAVKYDIHEYVKTKQKDVDMLVCGSRGMGAMGRAFIGSVADYLVHNLSCAVVVVK
mmetsp:Transcript_15658/g.29560  ORF Transcript_15658/g.29560 Transcript_15658/m.29560 type:complete len:100 (-) Transcript_15658:133-432(-)